jgi:branched-subunit amino acid transport protein AzlD
MTLYSSYLIVIAVGLITFKLRLLPFIFRNIIEKNNTLKYIKDYLPASVMLILVIYTLKDINYQLYPYGLNELSSIFLVIILHLRYRNVLLSMISGTIFYIVLS